MNYELKMTGTEKEIFEALSKIQGTPVAVSSVIATDEIKTETQQINAQMSANVAEPQPLPMQQAPAITEANLLNHLVSLPSIDKDTPFTPQDRKEITECLTKAGVEFNKRNATHTLAKELLAVKGMAPAAPAQHEIPEEIISQYAAPQQTVSQPQYAPQPQPVQQTWIPQPAQVVQQPAQVQVPQQTAQVVQQPAQVAPKTIEDVKHALLQAVIRFGGDKPEGKAAAQGKVQQFLMQNFQAQTMSQIDPKNYGAVVAALNGMV